MTPHHHQYTRLSNISAVGPFVGALQVQHGLCADLIGVKAGSQPCAVAGGEVDCRGCYTAMATLHLLKIDPIVVVASSGMVDFVRRCQASRLPCINTCAAVSSSVDADAVLIWHAQTMNWPARDSCSDSASRQPKHCAAPRVRQLVRAGEEVCWDRTSSAAWQCPLLGSGPESARFCTGMLSSVGG